MASRFLCELAVNAVFCSAMAVITAAATALRRASTKSRLGFSGLTGVVFGFLGMVRRPANSIMPHRINIPRKTKTIPRIEICSACVNGSVIAYTGELPCLRVGTLTCFSRQAAKAAMIFWRVLLGSRISST